MNKNIQYSILLIISILLSSTSLTRAQENSNKCGANISTVLKGDMLTINALFRNCDPSPVYYYHELTVKKTGGTNISANTQTGRVSVQPDIEKSLAETTINVAPGDIIDLELNIINNEKVISSVKKQFIAPKSDIQKP